MTRTEIAHQIYHLTNGRVNGERMSEQCIRLLLGMWLRDVGDSYIGSVTLADGEWLCEYTQYAAGEYDYYIPDTREQEEVLWDKLINR